MFKVIVLSMDDSFDWSRQDEAVITPTVSGIAAYENEQLDIVIRQEASWNEEGDSFVIVPRSAVPKLIQRLEELLKERG